MRFGLYFPNFGIFGDPATVVRIAITAEEAGWDGVFPWDHIHLGRWAGPVIDPWVALAAAATATRTIRLGTMVTPLPRRRPSTLARQTTTLDHLSGGRVILGVGIGWPPEPEFEVLGDAGDNRVRGEQLDEALEVLDALWSGQPVHHEGRHYTARGVRFEPTPVQQPRIPVWVGGMWPRKPAFRRAARWDGVYPIAIGETPDDFVLMTPDTLSDILAYIGGHRDTDAHFDAAVSGSSFPGAGSAPPAEFADAGATWWIENVGWPPEVTLDAWLDFIAAGPPR